MLPISATAARMGMMISISAISSHGVRTVLLSTVAREASLPTPDKSRYRTSPVLGLHMYDNGVYQDSGFLIIASDRIAALLEAGDVGNKGFHFIRRQLRRGHASGFHLRGGMAQ